MEKEKIQEFTRRISMNNRGGLVVTMYDILFTYIEDAKSAYEKEDAEEFKTCIRQAEHVVVELEQSLNFHYEIAKTLYPLYIYCNEELAKSMVKHNIEGIENAKKVLTGLYAGFVEAAKRDKSEPLMRNTQQVYAGITYGKNDLTENFQDPETSRGFFA